MDASKSAQLAPGGEIASARARAAAMLVRRDRWRAAEVLPWLAAVAAFFIFPNQMILGGQTLIMILFALSLDLILGYAGIVTLGHAAYFGIGAYTAALMIADLGWNDQGNALVLTNLLNQHLPGPWGRIRAAPGAAVPISPPTAPGGIRRVLHNSNSAKRLGAYSPTKPARFRWMASVSRSPAGRTRAQQAAVAASRASACTCRPLAA